jgi:heavy metal translocating P-type ATPase
MKSPYQFDEYFAQGKQEALSPFLTPSSRKWGHRLDLRASLAAALLLAGAFALSFIAPPFSLLSLSAVYFLAGTPALIAALDDLRNLEVNIDVLMTLAAFIAVLIGSPFEGALLLVLFELSHGMEHAVSDKARSALHNLNHLAPKFALVIDPEGRLFERSVREIPLNTRIFVKSGEIVPLDGTVVEGSSSVNLVHLTGESTPIPKRPGDLVPAGARNLEAALTIEVTKTSSESTLSRIIRLIHEAASAKPKLQRFLDTFGKRYAASIIALTLLFASGLPLVTSLPYAGHEGAIYRALAFLIAASPCALIIATPTAYLSAISSCARRGILLKGGASLDALASCTQIAFDKTGTLTQGKLSLAELTPLSSAPLSEAEALAIAASLERHVVHPIASALIEKAEEARLPVVPLMAVQTIPGFGIEARLRSDETVAAAIGLPDGIAARLSPAGAERLAAWVNAQKGEGRLLAALSVGPHLFGLSFVDAIRSDAPALIAAIQGRLQPIMLTGDHRDNAETVGRQIGISSIYAGLKPEDKLNLVADLVEKGPLAMVGDGINDAPALARATVGISMGKIGSATAVDASDVVLLNDDLTLLPWLFAQARRTLRIVRQNLILALSVIAFATLPALLGLVPLWVAVLLHEGGTVLVGLNSLRLLRPRTQ